MIQKAMTTLAHASASLTSRLGALEREMESQKLRMAELAARHLNRVETLEAQLGEVLVRRTAPASVRAARDNDLWREDNSERWRCIEEKLQLQLDAGRADAAAARAAASWPGITDDLLQASVSAALDEAAPQFVAEAAAIAVRELAKLPIRMNKDDVTLQCQLARDVLETKELALDALSTVSRLDADIRSRPSREETSSIAEEAACRHSNLLKSFVVSDRTKLNTSWPPSTVISPEVTQDPVHVGSLESSGSANSVIFDAFERRCDVFEKRCDEIVCILNRKAYKSDVTRALASLERVLQRVYREGSRRCRPPIST